MLKKTTIGASLVLLAACGGEPSEETDGQELQQDPGMAAEPTAQEAARATAELRDAQGASVGTATLEESESGVRITLRLTGLPQGTHGYHIHETGECTTPDFASAGGHFNPTNRQHGLENPQGPHAGDLENIEVGGDGSANFTADNDRITLSQGPNSVLDADGSAIVIHAQADDNVTDPSGNSGDRIACGVITRG